MNEEQLRQVQQDPIGMGQKAGYEIPQELANDPQAMVMHLIQTGQVKAPLLQRIMPWVNKLQGK